MSSGRSVSYRPPGDLKSGMPAAQLTPAPVNTTTFWHASLARYAATPLTSRLARRIAATARAAQMTRNDARIVVYSPRRPSSDLAQRNSIATLVLPRRASVLLLALSVL